MATGCICRRAACRRGRANWPSARHGSYSGGEDGFAATVAKATYVGVRMEYSLKTSFGSIFAVEDDVFDPLKEGTAVKVSFKPSGPVLIPPD